MDAQEIGRLTDKELVQVSFDEYFGPYMQEGHQDRLLNAQYKALRDASAVLAWNPLKRRLRSRDVAEARSRLRGWLYERLHH